VREKWPNPLDFPHFFCYYIYGLKCKNMTIKLAVLKSGEDIIADMQEMILDEKVIGYFFDKPCVAKLSPSETVEDSFKISLYPWIPLSKTTRVPVINDWVITIVDPIDKLSEMYVNEVLSIVENVEGV
jgi:hypothetical protein